MKSRLNAAVFIPAMGSCHQIPRKFVRLLNDRPLISYSITLALEIAVSKDVFLLTDDEEIQLIGSRAGVRSILIQDRADFPRVFGRAYTIDLLLKREEARKRPFDHVIWMGASSPLVRARDIGQAVWYLDESSYDAVFSTSEEPQRSWMRREDRTFLPAFNEVQNAMGTDFMHKETGAFFIMKRRAISPQGYIGNLARPFLLPESHSLEICSFNDWWVAEKILRRKQIVFVVTGSLQIGMGHVFRALMLAQELTDHEIQFVCTRGSELAGKYIAEDLYPVFYQGTNESLTTAVAHLSPDLVINDILDTDASYMKALKDRHIRVVNFEDRGSGGPVADLCINALYLGHSAPNVLSGYKYFWLRSEFVTAKPQPPREKVRAVLVTFGGTDDRNMTLRLIRLLLPLALEHSFKIIAVAGPGNVHRHQTERFLEQCPSRQRKAVKWIANGTRQISEHMSSCDLAICSAGRTVYELTALRVPAVVIPVNEREEQHTFGKNAGMVFLPLYSKLSDQKLLACISELVSNRAMREKIHKKLGSFDFSQGKRNITSKIIELLQQT
ncbi:MAG: glycosyltransferase [Terracidiphilus sp.]